MRPTLSPGSPSSTQRGQRTPSGQRSAARYSWHLSSDWNRSISSGRFVTVETPAEPDRDDEDERPLPELPDADALRRLFPPEVVEEVERETAEPEDDED